MGKGIFRPSLPDHWQLWLQNNPAYGLQLNTRFFPSTAVTILFPVGSSARFAYAFCVHNGKTNELAVFTEHCVYHVFPAIDLEWDGLELPWDEP